MRSISFVAAFVAVLGAGFGSALAQTAAPTPADAGHGHGSHAETTKHPASAPTRQPSLRIVAPGNDARVGPDVVLEFETTADLAKMTMGSAPVGVHLHPDIDGSALMPALADLKRVGKNRYRYAFELPAAPGPHVLSVYWSDASHKTLESTRNSVSVTVLPKTAATAKP
jgi:hypothetical protein